MPEYHQYPLMLAGPILRRVESRSVSVWMALSKPSLVSLSLWQGRIDTGTSGKVFSDKKELHRSHPVHAKRVGENLYITVVTLKIPAEVKVEVETESGGVEEVSVKNNPLLPDTTYSYNINFHDPNLFDGDFLDDKNEREKVINELVPKKRI